MPSLRACLPVLAALTLAVGSATAQPLANGAPDSSLTLDTGSWGLRNEKPLGLKWKPTETGLSASSLSEPQRSELYADWFPYGNGFRVVSGLSFNDAGTTLSSSMVRNRAGFSAPYVGIGYSQTGKGLGFFADMGVSLGSLFRGGDTDADYGAQLQQDGWRTLSNGWLGLRYQPSVSLGLVYRY
jgi:hypothetical protein